MSIEKTIDDILTDERQAVAVEEILMDAARDGEEFMRIFFVEAGSETMGVIRGPDGVVELSSDELSTCMAFPERLRTALVRRFGADTIRCVPHRLAAVSIGSCRAHVIEHVEVVVWWSVATDAAEQRRRL